MDTLDKQIITLLTENARMTVKEIAARVSLTSPAVSERIRRMERSGVISGYTVVLGSPPGSQSYINALVSVSLPQAERDSFLALMDRESAVRQCFQVTGRHSYILKVCCRDVPALEDLINLIQEQGQTSTQIILSTMIDRSGHPLHE